MGSNDSALCHVHMLATKEESKKVSGNCLDQAFVTRGSWLL